jgi:hypothetical protein
VARVLHDTGIQPSALWLEITESTLMRDAESALSALGALQALGLHLAVDDFGTGYSSLAYLERLPVEALKIDRSFTEGVGVRKDSTAIVGASSGLARALRCRRSPRASRRRSSIKQLRAMGCEVGRATCSGPPAAAEVTARPRGLSSAPLAAATDTRGPRSRDPITLTPPAGHLTMATNVMRPWTRVSTARAPADTVGTHPRIPTTGGTLSIASQSSVAEFRTSPIWVCVSDQSRNRAIARLADPHRPRWRLIPVTIAQHHATT